MEKIDIYVPNQIGETLVYDAQMFEIFKKDDRAINKNKFLNLLIKGYYVSYTKEVKDATEVIKSVINADKLSDEEIKQITDAIIDKTVLPQVPSRKGKHPTKFSLKPKKDTESIITLILEKIGSTDYISQYFCKMIMRYCEKPFYQRERIIFKEKYEKLNDACIKKKSVSFKVNDIHTVMPYKVVPGREEAFNYLLCAEINPKTGKQETMSYRINRILDESIIDGTTDYYIDDEVKRHLDLMVSYGPQFNINDDEDTIVRLSEDGLDKFSKIYHLRPRPENYPDKSEKVNGYYELRFKCSKNQIFAYFRKFRGDEAIIASPEWLRDDMLAFHKVTYEAYLQQDG